VKQPILNKDLRKKEISWIVGSGVLSYAILFPFVAPSDRLLEYGISFLVFSGLAWFTYRTLPSKMYTGSRVGLSILGPLVFSMFTILTDPLGIVHRTGSNMTEYAGASLAVFLISRLVLLIGFKRRIPTKNGVLLTHVGVFVLYLWLASSNFGLEKGVLLYLPPIVFCIAYDLNNVLKGEP
jgi:hypothetical protein